MFKKKYIIITLAIVSTLFGSLLYITHVLAGKPQPLIYNDSTEIEFLDTPIRLSYPSWTQSIVLPFSFSSRGTFNKINGLWIAFYLTVFGSGEGGMWKTLEVNLTSNEFADFESFTFSAMCYYPLYQGYMTEARIYYSSQIALLPEEEQIIKPGINEATLEITITNPGTGIKYGVVLSGVTIFIEYEYQA